MVDLSDKRWKKVEISSVVCCWHRSQGQGNAAMS